MAFAFITSLLNTVEIHFLQPLPCLIFDDREMIESLCEKIRNLQAFLVDSHKNNISNKARRVLESEIRGVAHDAELKIESELYQFYLCCNEVEHPVKPPRSLYKTLQQVKRRIESIERRIQIESNNNHSVDPQRRNRIESIKAGSFSEPSSDLKNVMVGCEDEFLTIMQKLISDSEKREVISIVGMGGIGKTTLVRRVYQDATIISHFDIRAWVTVSQEHNLREMLLDLLGSIVANGDPVDNSQLANQLRKKLICRRYLIVIDDIWSIETWDDIHRCFPEEDFNGSRILLTTRLKKVADYASSGNNPLYMRFLNSNESWNLFYKKVFEEKNFSHEFEAVSRGIVTKCQGLPLTIIVVAGLLTSFNKPSLNQWGNVAENLNSLLNIDPEEKCSKILSLSYDNLPSHLKVLFLYFGVFPEDSEICVKALIRLWVAEGFLKLELNNTMEEVGKAYLQDLIDRGLVQIDKWSSDGKMKSCRLHDLLHSFCLREAQREKLLYVINEKNVEVARVQKPHVHTRMLMRIMRSMSSGSDPKACRWISSQIIRDLDMSIGTPITRASKIFRSILYFTNGFKWTYLSPKPFTFLKLLRVLDISLCFLDGIPSEIVNLVHLRYLALRNDSLLNLQWFKLRSLQTVIINTFDDRTFYWGSLLHVLDMPRLRHVYLPKSCFLNLPKLVQGNLQTIFWLNLPHRLRTELGFKTIPNVKELGIYIKDKDPYKLLPGSLADLRQLENLKIAVQEDVFFRGEFRLPTAFPSNLKKLKLIYTYLPWEDMAIIGTLPNLEVLKLMGYAFCGPDWRTKNGFYKLKHLQIVESDLKHWSVVADHFPVLECLILSCCGDLEEFPTAFADITTLQLIKLTHCCSSIVTSAKQIQEERLGLGDNKFVVRDFRTFFGRKPVQFSRREEAGYISSKKKLIYVKRYKRISL